MNNCEGKNTMETKTQTIEERLVMAEQEVARAQKTLDKFKGTKKEKDNLKARFQQLMGKTDLEIRKASDPERYGVTRWGCLGMGKILPLAAEDPALNVLYAFMDDPKRFYSGSSFDLFYAARDSMNKYAQKIWDRTITESEYSSIVNATEPFLGRYIQRVYDKRAEDAEAFQKSIDKEQKEYSTKHPAKRSEQVQAATPVASKRISLLAKLFGAK